jgi:hypothetical protein
MPPNSTVRIARLNVECILPREHRLLPAIVQSQLVDIAQRQLASACARLLAPICPENDSSVWFIRRLDVELPLDADSETDQLTRTWATQLTRSLARTVNGDSEDGSNVIRFSSRAAYLAQFLSDLADGVAWSKWYYAGFDGWRALSVNAALREALCREPAPGEAALWQLASDGRFAKVLRTLSEGDIRAVLSAFAGPARNGNGPGDELNASDLRAVWHTWQHASALLRAESRARAALQLCLALRRGGPTPSGSGLVTAIHAVLSLIQWMATPQADRFLTAFRIGDSAAAIALTKGADLETVSALFRCERAIVVEIAAQVHAHARRKAAAEAREPLYTPFGGVFRLLPHLMELDLEDCAAALPEFAEGSPIPLVRFLVLLKCLGAQRSSRAFFDPVLREIAGVPPDINAGDVRVWARKVTPEMTRDFQARWTASCYHRDVIRSRWLCLRSTRRGRLLLLADGERNLWLHAVRSVDELWPALQSIHESRFTDDELLPFLLCDPALVSRLPATLGGATVLAWNSPEAEQHAAEDPVLATCLARARPAEEELNCLKLIPLPRVAPHCDLALSLVAHAVLRGFAWRLPGFAWSSADYLYENFLDVVATIRSESEHWKVRLARAPLHVVLAMAGAAEDQYVLPWLNRRQVCLTTSEQ